MIMKDEIRKGQLDWSGDKGDFGDYIDSMKNKNGTFVEGEFFQEVAANNDQDIFIIPVNPTGESVDIKSCRILPGGKVISNTGTHGKQERAL